ncbi:hypothetical protein [Yoonia sp. MH D7]
MDWLIANEFVETLSDIVLRRTSLAISGKVSSDVIAKIADRLQKAHDLTPDEISQQFETLNLNLSEFHGVSPDILEKRNETRREQCA